MPKRLDRMDAVRRELAAKSNTPRDEERLKVIKNWFNTKKPEIDRRADKYKR